MPPAIQLDCDLRDVQPSPAYSGPYALRAVVEGWDIRRTVGPINFGDMRVGELGVNPALQRDGVTVGRVLQVTRMADAIAIDFEFDPAGEQSPELYQRYAGRFPPMLTLGITVSGIQRDATGDSVTKWELDAVTAQPSKPREYMYDEDQYEWDG